MLPEGVARHWKMKLCLGISYKFDEFPDSASAASFLCITKVMKTIENTKHFLPIFLGANKFFLTNCRHKFPGSPLTS